MSEILDYKRAFKIYYQPSTKPGIIDVPEMTFFAVDGHRDPNSSDEYRAAVEMLYGLSYTIKMNKLSGTQPPDYYDYTVFPLEGLWWFEGEQSHAFDGLSVADKNTFQWRSMIRQPEFVDQAVLEFAKASLSKKKPQLDLSKAVLYKFTESLCVQCMHIGPYDAEPATVAAMHQFALEQGYEPDLSGTRRHHEIYLGDPRRTAPVKLKTVVRHPIRPI